MAKQPTTLEQRADTVAKLLGLCMAEALDWKGSRLPFGAPEVAGTERNGTLRIEMYLSVEDAEKLAHILKGKE